MATYGPYVPATSTQANIGHFGSSGGFGIADYGGGYIDDGDGSNLQHLFAMRLRPVGGGEVNLSGVTTIQSATLTLTRAGSTYGSDGANGTLRFRLIAQADPDEFATEAGSANPYNRTYRTAYVDVAFDTGTTAINVDVTTLVQDLITTYGGSAIKSICVGIGAQLWGLSSVSWRTVTGATTLPSLTITTADEPSINGTHFDASTWVYRALTSGDLTTAGKTFFCWSKKVPGSYGNGDNTYVIWTMFTNYLGNNLGEGLQLKQYDLGGGNLQWHLELWNYDVDHNAGYPNNQSSCVCWLVVPNSVLADGWFWTAVSYGASSGGTMTATLYLGVDPAGDPIATASGTDHDSFGWSYGISNHYTESIVFAGGLPSATLDEPWTGDLQFARIINSTLTQAQIKALSGTRAVQSNTWGEWQFTDHSVLDSSGNGRTLTVVSGGAVTTATSTPIETNAFLANVAETVTLAAQVAALRHLASGESESVVTSAALAALRHVIGTASETVTTSAALASLRHLLATESESVTTSASVSALRAILAGASETVTTSAAVTALRGLNGSAGETIATSAGVSALRGIMSAVAETVTMSASAAALRHILSTQSESMTVSASLSVAGQGEVALRETVLISDGVTAQRNIGASLSESVAISAGVTALRHLVAAISEAISIVDSEATSGLTASITDTVAWSDAIATLATHNDVNLAALMSTTEALVATVHGILGPILPPIGWAIKVPSSSLRIRVR